MRLLERGSGGQFSFTKDHIDNLPAYAILSHTWGPDEDEVTFDDVKNETINSRTGGYKKLQFCEKQAGIHGLTYFWVDTCCIDKANHVELSEAITSMFRWYQESAKCYVYLSDVSAASNSDDQSERTWEADFCKSRWFRRGWTLQELLAPTSVEFFSREGTSLGSKKTLEELIHKITKIRIIALQGKALSHFSPDERLGWIAGRNTKRPEDMAYCLLGIFSIYMAPRYGEGEKEVQRLKDKINKQARISSNRADERPFKVPFYVEAKATPNFVGREAEIAELEQTLIPDTSNVAHRSIFVAHGMGGIGKTQIALSFAHKQKELYSAIIWLDGSSKSSLKKSFADFASRLRQLGEIASEQLEGDSDTDTQEVLYWLSLPDNKDWLMIFDNVDRDHQAKEKDEQAYDIETFFPRAYHGAILITTRLNGHFRLGEERKIEGINNGDALRILETNMGRSVRDDEDWQDTLQKFQGLPLALTLAGSYIRDTEINLSQYNKQYEQKWQALIKSQDRYQLREYADRSMQTTWLMSLEQVELENSDAVKLLELWSFLANSGLSFKLFDSVHRFRQKVQVPGWLIRVMEDNFTFASAVRPLIRYSLINKPDETSRYSVHSVLHEWCFDRAQQRNKIEEIRTICGVAAALIAYRAPFDNSVPTYWQTRRDLLPHATKVCQRIDQCFGNASDEACEQYLPGEVMFNLVMLLSSLEELQTPGNMLLRAFTGYERALRPEHMLIFVIMSNLESLYSTQGELDEAEKIHSQVLARTDKALEPEHPFTLYMVGNLGNLYYAQGKFDAAEKIYSQALARFEKVLGPEHMLTLDIVSNLGAACYTQGRVDEAEKMSSRALAAKEKVPVPEHVFMLVIMNTLGSLYSTQGKLDEAEKIYSQVLAGFEKVLGPEHMLTLDVVSNLGAAYYTQGRVDEAEKMYLRALTGRERVLGCEHTSTLQTANNLGHLFYKQGKLDEAEKMCAWALAGYEKTFGPSHQITRAVNLGYSSFRRASHSISNADVVGRTDTSGCDDGN